MIGKKKERLEIGKRLLQKRKENVSNNIIYVHAYKQMF